METLLCVRKLWHDIISMPGLQSQAKISQYSHFMEKFTPRGTILVRELSHYIHENKTRATPWKEGKREEEYTMWVSQVLRKPCHWR